jgi:Tol biopolymer transport system component
MKIILSGLVLLPLAAEKTALANEGLLEELRSYPHKIVFESYVDDNWELFLMNADGSGRRNLTNTPDVHELYPQASPDGTKICFLADVMVGRDTLRSVYYMNADGSGRKLVAEKARQPCWSPDGKKIAFLPQEFSRFAVTDYVSKGLRIYDLESESTVPHPNQAIHHLYTLNWSSNGKWFVSTVHGGMGFGHAIIALSAAGNEVHDLKVPGCRPSLSADGARVTWSSDDHTIMVADVDLESGTPAVSNQVVIDKRVSLHLYHPDLSPDGRYITYSIGPGGRVPANGPGTHTQVAEMVGVRGKWNIFLKRSTGEGEPVQLTMDEMLSNKESEWVISTSSSRAGGQ